MAHKRERNCTVSELKGRVGENICEGEQKAPGKANCSAAAVCTHTLFLHHASQRLLMTPVHTNLSLSVLQVLWNTLQETEDCLLLAFDGFAVFYQQMKWRFLVKLVARCFSKILFAHSPPIVDNSGFFQF